MQPPRPPQTPLTPPAPIPHGAALSPATSRRQARTPSPQFPSPSYAVCVGAGFPLLCRNEPVGHPLPLPRAAPLARGARIRRPRRRLHRSGARPARPPRLGSARFLGVGCLPRRLRSRVVPQPVPLRVWRRAATQLHTAPTPSPDPAPPPRLTHNPCPHCRLLVRVPHLGVCRRAPRRARRRRRVARAQPRARGLAVGARRRGGGRGQRPLPARARGRQ